jgi:hypothetical protein
MVFFALGGFSGRDNPYDRIIFPEAMTYDKNILMDENSWRYLEKDRSL